MSSLSRAENAQKHSHAAPASGPRFSHLTLILICSIAAIVLGGICWVCMLSFGLLATTTLNNIANWGLLIAIFAFLVGFGAGSQLLASVIAFANRQDLLPFLAPAQAIALAGACGAGVAIVADLGSPFHMLALLAHPNFGSPLTWDMIALTVFIAVAVVDMVAIARQWKSLKFWMGVGIASALFLQIVEGVLFAAQSARSWWHSFIMPIDFVLVALISGLAIMTIVCCLSKDPAGKSGARTLARWLFWLVVIHVCLALLELAMIAGEGEGAPQMVLRLVVDNLWLYIVELALPLAAVIVMRISLKRESSDRLFWCSIALIVGLFAHRLMLLIPAVGGATFFTTLSNEPAPMWAYPISTGFYAAAKETFALTVPMWPSWIEWISLLLPLGATVLVAYVGWRLIRPKA